MTAAEIQARIDAIQKARDTGVLMVRHGDSSTQFRSLDEMNRVITDLKKQLNDANGVVKSRVNYIKQSSKGYGDYGSFYRNWQ